MKRPPRIREALTAATCTLLSGPAAAGSPLWRTDAALLLYTEDQRVTVVEPLINTRKEIGEEEFLNLRFVADVMTGASPNGASPSNTPQTFTSPSGKNEYTVSPGDTPLNDFADLRGALALDWEQRVNPLLRATTGVAASIEADYSSLGFNGNLLRDFNDKHTTLTTGLSVNLDRVHPGQGIPSGLTGTTGQFNSISERQFAPKQTADIFLGVTQILNRRSLMQMNYTYSRANGYLTDPYKLLSVVDNSGATLGYLTEQRPDSRTRQALLWKGVYHFTEDVVHVSYRYYRDDWGIVSHTFDLQYRYELPAHHYLQPHIRWYRQGAADFYRHSLATGQIPDYASADYRLGELQNLTLGVKYGLPLTDGREFSLRLERMVQTGDRHPDDATGIQNNLNLFPTVGAWIIQAEISFDLDLDNLPLLGRILP